MSTLNRLALAIITFLWCFSSSSQADTVLEEILAHSLSNGEVVFFSDSGSVFEIAEYGFDAQALERALSSSASGRFLQLSDNGNVSPILLKEPQPWIVRVPGTEEPLSAEQGRRILDACYHRRCTQAVAWLVERIDNHKEFRGGLPSQSDVLDQQPLDDCPKYEDAPANGYEKQSDSYTLACRGGHLGHAGYPRYDSKSGVLWTKPGVRAYHQSVEDVDDAVSEDGWANRLSFLRRVNLDQALKLYYEEKASLSSAGDEASARIVAAFELEVAVALTNAGRTKEALPLFSAHPELALADPNHALEWSNALAEEGEADAAKAVLLNVCRGFISPQTEGLLLSKLWLLAESDEKDALFALLRDGIVSTNKALALIKAASDSSISNELYHGLHSLARDDDTFLWQPAEGNATFLSVKGFLDRLVTLEDGTFHYGGKIQIQGPDAVVLDTGEALHRGRLIATILQARLTYDDSCRSGLNNFAESVVRYYNPRRESWDDSPSASSPDSPLPLSIFPDYSRPVCPRSGRRFTAHRVSTSERMVFLCTFHGNYIHDSGDLVHSFDTEQLAEPAPDLESMIPWVD